jgi:hypothetical protein
VDDRIDAVTRGLLGITVACARCHDHKFDPIPSKDYYSLYSILRTSASRRHRCSRVERPSAETGALWERLARSLRRIRNIVRAGMRRWCPSSAQTAVTGGGARRRPATAEIEELVRDQRLNSTCSPDGANICQCLREPVLRFVMRQRQSPIRNFLRVAARCQAIRATRSWAKRDAAPNSTLRDWQPHTRASLAEHDQRNHCGKRKRSNCAR